jgi:hypothetical protein
LQYLFFWITYGKGGRSHERKESAPVENEISTMLTEHAATALCRSKLCSQSEGKLSTVQGLHDLLIGKEEQAI